MSQRQSTTVACPECGHSQEFLIWPSLNVSLDPEEKPRLLNGELHRFTCGKCSAQTQVAYPLLYHDMDRKLMIHNIEEADRPEEFSDGILGNVIGEMRKSYTFRYVHSRNELIEKIKIADAGLDDRVVEIFKILIRGQIQELAEGDFFFDHLESTPVGDETITFFWLTDDGGQEIPVPLATYRAYEPHLEKLVAADTPPDGMWQRVDIEYASNLVARQGKT